MLLNFFKISHFCWHFLLLFGPDLQTGKQTMKKFQIVGKTSYLSFFEFKIRMIFLVINSVLFILKRTIGKFFFCSSPKSFSKDNEVYNRIQILKNHWFTPQHLGSDQKDIFPLRILKSRFCTLGNQF